MYYTRLLVTCSPDFSDILMAEVAEAGFDTFLEVENGFEAYTEEPKADLDLLEIIKKKYEHVEPLVFFQDRVDRQNWNEEWEKNVDPVVVEDECLIRAEFHKIEKKYPYEIIITPKMSFGTGHHQTTYLMIKNQLSIDHKNKIVMDAGCGTAILSVMASKLGAKKIESFDIDDWSIENGIDNADLNHTNNINIRKGTIGDFTWYEQFEIILANINKNVLLSEMASYSQNLVTGGLLLLSGFYVADASELLKEAGTNGLALKKRDEKESWASLLLYKTS